MSKFSWIYFLLLKIIVNILVYLFASCQRYVSYWWFYLIALPLFINFLLCFGLLHCICIIALFIFFISVRFSLFLLPSVEYVDFLLCFHLSGWWYLIVLRLLIWMSFWTYLISEFSLLSCLHWSRFVVFFKYFGYFNE